jgi:hypothetical protein
MSKIKNLNSDKEKYNENDYNKLIDKSQSLTSNCDTNSIIKKDKDINSSSRLKKTPRIRSKTIFAFQVFNKF